MVVLVFLTFVLIYLVGSALVTFRCWQNEVTYRAPESLRRHDYLVLATIAALWWVLWMAEG